MSAHRRNVDGLRRRTCAGARLTGFSAAALRSGRMLARFAALLAALSIIASMSLSPGSDAVPTDAPVAFFGERAGADALLNVVFYVPLGLALGWLPLRVWAGLLVGILVTLTMETLQLAIPGRFASLSDLVANTTGTAAGIALIRTYPVWAVPPPAVASRLSLTASVAFAGVCFATAYLMTPELPEGVYVGQWTPDLGQYEEPYGGRVHSVKIGAHLLPSTTVPGSEGVRTLLLTEEPLVISARTGPPPASLSPLFRLVRKRRTPVLSVGVDGSDLALEVRMRASDWRLTRPSLYAPGIMSGVQAGSDVRIEVWKAGSSICVAVDSRTDCTLTPTLGSGWRLLLDPAPGSPRVLRLLSFSWLFLLALPTGLWLRPTRLSAIAVVALCAGVVGAPPGGTVTHSDLWEWSAILLGLASGVAMNIWVAGSGRTTRWSM